MKRIYLTLALALTIFALQSCGGGAMKDGKETADSINEANTPEDMEDSLLTAPVAVAESDAEFVTEAANGGMAEVELGQLAQQKAQNGEVKAFAEMMIKDHTKANEELKALADSKNITLPAAVASEQQQVKDKLTSKPASEFDKAYIADMVEDHEKDVKLFEDASKNLKDPDLKAFVDKTLPTLRNHLDHSKRLNGQLK
ncbi:DUF4142 domain-containing protein [Sphingobacterium sp. N143]|uniref:DUF4142 domain-containing protein n=1 Tax=Sphingobacterium sp. N143 TaxID=2746727 RepID=UPI002577228B|nr:DUF4142 domain-containing protein [Sphingobacterium sp. N143]MDM1295819.1 DUF4142 domain-containing protein [Sphingobacterium sp. N143]